MFIDLSNVLDTVDPSILLIKHSYLGIEETYLRWCKSYINNRKQYISFKNKKADN